jgi:hypothetical protein
LSAVYITSDLTLAVSPYKEIMKTSLAVAATLLVVFAAAFAMVQMDLIDAGALRFLPAIAAIVIAFGLISPAIAKKMRKRRGSRHSTKKDKK